jgi:soluble lytic murein transglycosylase
MQAIPSDQTVVTNVSWASLAKVVPHVYWRWMRWRGSQPTRALPLWAWMFCAVLAAAGDYSVAHAQRAGQDDQAALAVPRVALRGAAGVAMPQPLAPSDAARIKRIFSLQAAGNLAEARRETERLDNSLLFGPILADRYLNPTDRPTAAELTDWLQHYGEQPDAPMIQGLLDRLGPAVRTDEAPARKGRTAPAPSRVHAMFVANRDAEAVAAARPLLDGGDAGALIDGGLAAWRLDDSKQAGDFFAAAYRAAAGSATRAKAAYWMSRAQDRTGQQSAATVWMRLAAQEGDSFYGLIARRALGLSFACLTGQTLGTADVDALLASPGGRRAFALLQVGEKRRAEAELRLVWLDGSEAPSLGRALLLLARATGLSRLAAELEPVETVSEREGGPLPNLQPAGGFIVDPALVYALVRHESNFRAGVVSRSGAKGLMQLMPRTAHAVAGSEASHLADPAVNLAIGQRYILALADDEAVDGDLIRLLAGYNQGEFGLRRWVDTVHDGGEPLLFLEAMPNAAARAFVEESLELSWHYASLLHRPASSLDDLAAGRHPRLMRAEETGMACTRTVAAR